MKYRILIVAIALATLLSAPSCKSKPLGTADNPIKLWFMPQRDQAVFEANAPVIKSYLEKKTGFAIETKLAPSYIDIVKALGQKKADIAFMNSLGYLLANDWAGARAVLQYVYGDVYKDYRGEFIARVGAGIDTPADLDGKTLAFTDPYSASGYLYALKYLKDHDIKPSKTLFTGSHLKAAEMVYKGEVDAAAIYHEGSSSGRSAKDARTQLEAKYPDILSMVKVIALTDEIPNGPEAVRKKLTDEMVGKLTAALSDFARTPKGRKTLLSLYGMTGLTPVTDASYDSVRKVIQELGKTVQDTVPGGAPYYRTYMEPGLD